MFDNSKPNVIIITDKTSALYLDKTLGPYKVAYMLRQAGYEVLVIHHASVFSWKELEHTLRHAISDQTLFIGFNNFFYSDISRPDFLNQLSESFVTNTNLFLPHGIEYNDKLRNLVYSINDKCKFALGGPNAVDSVENGIFDYVVCGYAEMSIVNLADHLHKGTELAKSYKSQYGPVIITDHKAELYDFSTCKMSYSDGDAILPGETLVIEVARGCIFKCTFCAFPLNGKKKSDYVRNFDLLRKELIENYERFGVTRYILSDDTINDSPEKCQMLGELGDSLPFELEWHGYIRLDLLMAHPETVDQLYRGGMRSAFFGIETFNTQAAKAVNKAGNKQKQVDFVRKMKEQYGSKLALHGNFIAGLPYESKESLNETVDFLMSEESPFDTWQMVALSLKEKTAVDNYYSEMDLNYTKYGYIKIHKADERPLSASNAYKNNYVNWQNEHMTLDDAQKFAEMCERRRTAGRKFKTHGRVSFDEASITGKLVLAQQVADNMYELNTKKLVKAKLYKNTLWEKNGIPVLPDELTHVERYNEWLEQANGFKYLLTRRG